MDVIDLNLSIIQLYECVSDDYEPLIVKQHRLRRLQKAGHRRWNCQKNSFLP
jgi:hypothetical protein